PLHGPPPVPRLLLPLTAHLFPYTPLFRSGRRLARRHRLVRRLRRDRRPRGHRQRRRTARHRAHGVGHDDLIARPAVPGRGRRRRIARSGRPRDGRPPGPSILLPLIGRPGQHTPPHRSPLRAHTSLVRSVWFAGCVVIAGPVVTVSVAALLVTELTALVTTT